MYNSGKKRLREQLNANNCEMLDDETMSSDSKLTIVDQLQLRNDVQTDIRELILEHLEEHREKVSDGPGNSCKLH